MSKKYIFGISALAAIGVFFLAFGYAVYGDAVFFFAVMNYPKAGIAELMQMLKDAGFSAQEIGDWVALRITQAKIIGSMFITAGAGTIVAAFLLYRHRDKQTRTT